MATIVESTIGGTSPDYATIEAWLSATEVNLVSADQIQRGLLRSGTYNEILDINGATTDATRYRELTFDTGARYDPEAGTGAKITGSTTGQTVDLWENYFRMTGIGMERTAASGNVIWINTNGTGVILDGCTARSTATENSGFFGAVAGPILRNCIAINTLFDGTGEGITVAEGMKAHNCVGYGFSWSLSWGDNAATEVINCIAAKGTGGDSSFNQYAADTLGTYNYNICVGDSNAPGTNATDAAVAADLWTDPSNDDFTLKSGSDAIDNAEDLSSDFTTSIDGTDRGTTPGEWDAGAYAYSEVSGGVTGSASFEIPIPAMASTGSVSYVPTAITGTSAFDIPLPTMDATGTALGAGGGITITLNTSRTTVVAGEAVDFNIVGTTSSETTNPFHEIYWDWDFDDSSNLDNTAVGPVASHIFRDPGSYTVTVRGRDTAANSETDTVAITVQDPDTVYATTDTISISTTADFTGAATGSTRITTSSWDTACTYIARGKRVEFHAGQTWTTSAGTGIDLSTGSGIALVTKFGSGADPTVDLDTTPSGHWILLTIYNTGYFAIRDFQTSYSGGAHTERLQFIANDHRCDYVSIVDISCSGMTFGIAFSASAPEYYSESPHEHVAIHRYTTDITVGAGHFCGGNHFSYVGCDLGPVTWAGNHLLRFTGGNYFYISGNSFGSSTGGQIKAHSYHPWASAADTSRYWNWYGNVFAGSVDPYHTGIGPQNADYDERIQDVVVDSHSYVLDVDAHFALLVTGGVDVTIRNCKATWGSVGGVGYEERVFFVGNLGSVAPDPGGVEIYHCSAWGSGTMDFATLVQVNASVADTPIVKNCAIWAPSASTVRVNEGTITGGGNSITDPSFVDAANFDFALLPASTAIDNGVAVEVLNSYNNGPLRVLSGNTADSGAYETLSDPTGTAAFTIPMPTMVASGTTTTLPIGTAEFTIPMPTMYALGTAIAEPPITGTSEFTIPLPEMVAQGTVSDADPNGTAEFEIPLPVMSASGTVTPLANNVTGTAAFTIPMPTMAATGTAPGAGFPVLTPIAPVIVKPEKTRPRKYQTGVRNAVFDLSLWEDGGGPRSSIGSTVPGVVTNATWQYGAMEFDGTGDYVTFGGERDMLDETSFPFTFAARFRCDSTTGVHRIFGATSATANGWSVGVTDLTPRLTLWNGPVNIDAAPVSIVAGRWHIIHVVFEADKSVKFYLNGGIITDTSTATSVLSNTSDWILGAAASGAEFWEGGIDWVRVRDTAMTQQEVVAEVVDPWRDSR